MGQNPRDPALSQLWPGISRSPARPHTFLVFVFKRSAKPAKPCAAVGSSMPFPLVPGNGMPFHLINCPVLSIAHQVSGTQSPWSVSGREGALVSL